MFYKRYNAPMVEVWQYLDIQQGWWIRSWGAGEAGAREGGKEGVATLNPRRTGNLQPTTWSLPSPTADRPPNFFRSSPPNPAQHSPFCEEVGTQSSSETGRGGSEGGGVWAVGGGCSVRHSSTGRWVRGVGAQRSGEIKSRPKREKEKRRGGVMERPLPKINPPAPTISAPERENKIRGNNRPTNKSLKRRGARNRL